MIIQPFAALRSTPESAPRVASVPYDVVDTAEARALAAGNRDSFLHVVRPEIDFPAGSNPTADAVYQRARENLADLRRRGMLVVEDSACLYAYRMTMGSHAQLGLLGCCSVDEYERGVLKKHELTRQDKEDDRTRHMLAIGAQPGPVLMTYRDHRGIGDLLAAAAAGDPLLTAESEQGVRHEIWRIAASEALARAFAEVPCAYIADGHHRSASAARARQVLRAANPQHRGDEAYNFFLAVLFPASRMKILAYNRLVWDLNGHDPQGLLGRAAEHFEVTAGHRPVPVRPGCIAVYVAGRWHTLTIKPELAVSDHPAEALDCTLLQRYLIEPILGIRDIRTDDRIAFAGGSRGTEYLEQRINERGGAAFSLCPTTIDQLMAVADAAQIMPPKSTWFEPKLRSGLVVHLLG